MTLDEAVRAYFDNPEAPLLPELLGELVILEAAALEADVADAYGPLMPHGIRDRRQGWIERTIAEAGWVEGCGVSSSGTSSCLLPP